MEAKKMPKNIMTDAEVKLTGYLSEKNIRVIQTRPILR